MAGLPDPNHLRLLAGLLAAPEADSFSVLTELAEKHPWLREPLIELSNLGLPHWQAEHTRLFISNYPKTLCPPFESAYRGGAPTGELTALYLRIGLEANDISSDYLGAMLECAAYLLEEPDLVDADDLWRELWDDHLAAWIPRFAKNLIDTENSPLLYRRLGKEFMALFTA
uniref:Chaperone TorD involved in molybdoenzyme TorA maturation n=1 Tax=Candidatus Kentrum sp. SD TaxID=2126332 RepID=A0A451BIM1_9GAMM|nr:MAG: chaperone TorD involved in molybdoenzyme TorA maturation [Candidatus Kentron sp. SD]VFK42473.1 MAG: chaperone TorD involved in molybdoenzyme TorA maturation [Candidatus Kentron sp. SD]VFK78145.1 MAG: chaperone TorD involved in molybdoenzyme TorA maturation [Candidatus Kentron sp. SD]